MSCPQETCCRISHDRRPHEKGERGGPGGSLDADRGGVQRPTHRICDRDRRGHHPDLRQARVHVSVLGDDAERERTLEGLEAAHGLLSRRWGGSCA